MLFYLIFEGDLPENRNSMSKILVASDELVGKSFTEIREGMKRGKRYRSQEDFLRILNLG